MLLCYVKGTVFSPVPFQLDQPLQPPSPELDAEQTITAERKGIVATLQEIVHDSLKRIFHPNDVSSFQNCASFLSLFCFNGFEMFCIGYLSRWSIYCF